MRTYLATTGALFLLVTLAHVWRATQESHLARDPWFIFVTMVSLLFAVWAVRLFRKTARS